MKRIIVLMMALLFLLSFSACSGMGMTGQSTTSADTVTEESNSASMTTDSAPEMDMDMATAPSESGISTDLPAEQTSEKIIYSASAEIETTDFDASIDAVDRLIEFYGAFLQSSSVNGTNYGNGGDRYATYTIRIPANSFSSVREALDTLGNVNYYNVWADNITTQYYDVQSRLTAYETEEARLLEILASCETVTDLIAVESQLTEVRYEIESLTTTLRNWQNQVDYSTLSINLYEVEKLSEQQPQSFGEEVQQALSKTFSFLGEAGREVLKAAICVVAVLALPAVVVTVLILLIRHRRRKKKNMDADPEQK